MVNLDVLFLRNLITLLDKQSNFTLLRRNVNVMSSVDDLTFTLRRSDFMTTQQNYYIGQEKFRCKDYATYAIITLFMDEMSVCKC